MSNVRERATREERRRREERERYLRPRQVVCLHCGNPFNPDDGVVTPDAAICDVCNGSD